MNADQLADLCRRQGHEVRVRRGEVQIKRCLFCGNSRWNLELSASKGVYNCWACTGTEGSGSLRRFLAQQLGVEDADVTVDLSTERLRRPENSPEVLSGHLSPAWDIPSARRYLVKRGVEALDTRRYEIFVHMGESHKLYGRIVFRVRDYFRQDHVAWIGRSYVGEKPKYETVTDIRPLPVVGYPRAEFSSPTVLVEGVFDGIKVHKAGFPTAILLGVAETGLEQWAARMGSEARVVVALDGEAGEEAKRIRGLLEPVVGSVVCTDLPDGRDPADFDVAVIRRLVQTLDTKGKELEPQGGIL